MADIPSSRRRERRHPTSVRERDSRPCRAKTEPPTHRDLSSSTASARSRPPPPLQVELLAAVRPDDSTWTITRDMEAAAGFSVGVSLLMEKVDTTKQWPQLSP